jgi:hypothetical protein
MTRPARFRESDVTRAVKAVEKVGLCVSRVRFLPDGGFEVIAGETVANDKRNPLDRLHAA